MPTRMYRPVHAGEILQEFISDGLTVSSLAAHLDYPRVSLSKVLHGRLGVSPLLAVKLSEAFPSQSAEFWMSLQSNYELGIARLEKRKKVKPVKLNAAAENNPLAA